MKKSNHNDKHRIFLLTWPAIIIMVATLFIIDFFTVSIYRSERDDYEDMVKDFMTKANYQEAVLRLQSAVKDNGGEIVHAGFHLDYLPPQPGTSGTGNVIITKNIEEGLDDPNESADDFERIFKESSTAKDVATKLAAGVNVALKGLRNPDLNVFDSVLVSFFESEKIYTPYKLELVFAESPELNTSIVTEGYHTPIVSRFVHELPQGTDAGSFIRFTSSPFRLISKEIAGILILELVALLLILLSAYYLSKLLVAMKKIEMFREEFTHLVTHNMNNPISIALASAEALEKMECSSKDEKKEMYLSIICRQLRKLGEQVKSILTTCQVNASDGEAVEKIEIDLYQSVKSVADQMTVAHPEASISVGIIPDTIIKANPTLFDEVMNNLIQNAIKYSDKAPVISVSHTAEADGKEKIIVKDNGKGIPADKLENIFDKFYKVEKLSSTAGYGLGLHFVKQVVDQHGWDINVKSTVGEGTEFTIVLNP